MLDIIARCLYITAALADLDRHVSGAVVGCITHRIFKRLDNYQQLLLVKRVKPEPARFKAC
ncbi:hypothetical protein [Pseudomonas sp. RL_15y_Pfl2_60]|uniref:hypothetical protein n=1 Tax=Pseudomonas sp. RL_15y_Pfl2_60 TaxID=3088709 RepID=UPI0030DCCCD9